MEWLAIVGILCMVAGVALGAYGFMRAGIGLSPQVAYASNVNVELNTAAASKNPRRVRGARFLVAGFLLTPLGLFLVSLASN